MYNRDIVEIILVYNFYLRGGTMRIKGTTIYLTRGDTAAITVACSYDNGDPRPFIPGDTVYFTVKKSTRTDLKEIQKIKTTFDENGQAILELEHSDTINLSYGTYYYDIQLNALDGKVTTIIPVSQFIIEEEITYE